MQRRQLSEDGDDYFYGKDGNSTLHREQQMLLQEEEERQRLTDKIQALELELSTRQAFKAADSRKDDEIAADEVLDDIETKVLKNISTQWDDDSDSDEEENGDPSKRKEKDPTLSVLRYVRDRSTKLTSMYILVRNDTDLFQNDSIQNNINSDRMKDVLVETLQDMTFRFVLELVCEYWGVPINDGSLRLVDERGTWHRLDSTVAGSIRPSRRQHPVLYLQGKVEIEQALRELEHGRIDQMKFNAPNGAVLDVAPLLVSNKVFGSELTSPVREDEPNDAANYHTGGFGSRFQSLTIATRFIWKRDPILFTWRRVGFDFLLNLILFIILCIVLASVPRYRNSTGAAVMVKNSLVDVSFTSMLNNSFLPGNATTSVSSSPTAASINPTTSPTLITNSTTAAPVDARRLGAPDVTSSVIFEQISSQPQQQQQPLTLEGLTSIVKWEDFWGWVHGPLTDVVTRPYFLDPQAMLYGPVRFRQNRVNPFPCTNPEASNITCFPAYSSRTEQRDLYFSGTTYATLITNPTLTWVSGKFADYDPEGYIVEVNTQSIQGGKGCPILYDAQNKNKVCSAPNNSLSCWDCVINTLRSNNWLDDGTRLVVVEFLVYSADEYCFFDTRFAFELGVSGYIHTTYETRYISAAGPVYTQSVGYIVIISLLISVIGVQFFQGLLYVRAVWIESKQLVPSVGFSYFLQICWSLPTRFTIWNPIIFGLCVAGMVYESQPVTVSSIPPNGSNLDLNFSNINTSVVALQNGLVYLGVANMVVAYKLATYFEFTSKFIDYLDSIMENLFMLCVAMTLAVCSFAWLLTMSTTSMSIGPTSTFGDSFVFVVRMLIGQVTPTEFETNWSENWLTFSWVFYASQIVLNLILVKIAAPICYQGLKQGLGEYLLDTIAWIELSVRKWFAT